MKKEILRLIKEYEQNLRDMSGANNECQEKYGLNIYPDFQIDMIKAFLYDLHQLKNKIMNPDSDPPYSKEDYLKAKRQGFDLDNWRDYARFYGLGIGEEEEQL
jgi:hypothetical protein